MIRRHSPRRYSFAWLLAIGVAASPLAAQEHAHAPGDPRALGRVDFATTCSSDVTDDFDRAVAMLHSFWYEQAQAAFQAVAEADPRCAMAHWGVAMSRFRQLWVESFGPDDLRIGRAALARAASIGPRSDRERGFLDAVERFYEADDASPLDRRRAYEAGMEELYRRHGDDTEVATFYALAVLGTAFASPPDPAYAGQRKAVAILEELFADHPDHPGLAHYIIHARDYPELAQGAVEAARQYARIAPDAPHALHMPSHIFTRLGLWRESIDSNRAAAAAARRDGWTGEELHATDYLVYAHLQRAEDDAASRILAELPSRVEALRAGDSNVLAGRYAATAMPARYSLERRSWVEAAALPSAREPPNDGACWTAASLHFARGLGAARSGDPGGARAAIESLGRCREALGTAGRSLWADPVEAQQRTVAAWTALAEGDRDEALALMRSAADLEDTTDKPPITPGAILPARELLGEMLLELDRPAVALAAFESALEAAPNRFRSLHGAARAAALAGDRAAAADRYAALLEVAGDGERPELDEARAFLDRAR